MSGLHLCLLGDANSVHLRRWAAEMLTRGYRVSVVTARPGDIAGVEQRVLPPVSRSTDWLWRAGAARRAVDRLAPDIVHAHYVTSYGHLAARIDRHPLVMTAWGSDLLVTPHTNPLLHWLTGWTLRRADLATGDSQDLVEAIRRHAPRIRAEPVHWGADLAKFRPAPQAPAPGFEIVSLRAWDTNYNIDVIVAAFALLCRHLPESASGLPPHLHLLGGGPQEAALRAQVAGLGLASRVSFHGRVGDAAMLGAIQRCRVSVSIPSSDATSVSVLESMACGLPVLASDLPANRQWLAAGMLVPPRDPQALADALLRLAQHPDAAQRSGQANLARMQRDGSRQAQMDAMDALYRGLLPRRAARSAA
jgi:glycosyltransferase involved in cell wall biosynthesis